MNRKSDQQLITPNSNTAKPFMHQGREKKIMIQKLWWWITTETRFPRFLDTGLPSIVFQYQSIIIRDNPCWTGYFTLIYQDITTNADKTEIIEIECQH